MTQFQYKCVAVPRVIDTGKDDHTQAVSLYEKIIQDASRDGWELDRTDSVVSSKTPGCLAALLGKLIPPLAPIIAQAEKVEHKLLIFKKVS